MKYRTYTTITLSLLFIFLVSCAGAPTKKAKIKYPSVVTPEMQKQFHEIDYHYKTRRYDHAYSGFQHYIDSHPHNRLTDESLYKQGKIFFITARYPEAVQKFEYLAQKTPDPSYKAKARHLAGYAYYKNGQFTEALDEFRLVRGQNLPAKLKVQYHSLIIQAAEQGEDTSDFTRQQMFLLYDTYEGFAGSDLKKIRAADVISYRRTVSHLETWVTTPFEGMQIPAWVKKYPQAPARAYLDFKVAKTLFESGQTKPAKKKLEHYLKWYPKHQYSFAAAGMLKELGGSSAKLAEGKAGYKLGLVLPLTGRFESYGKSVLDGVKCGVGERNRCEPFSGVELVVRDSGVTPAQTRHAVQSLMAQGVRAIIGPLSGNLAIEAGLVASSQNVPIFPITQKSGLMAQGGSIFQLGIPLAQQIQDLVKEAFRRGYRTFGVLAPNNTYGQTLAEIFINEVRERGGKISAQSEYNRRTPDPYAEARKLKKTIGRMDRPTKNGFDALFIPDSYRLINTLAKALEFNEIVGMPLLGTSAWNDPGLSLLIEQKFPGSFFIDAYDADEGDQRVQNFQQRFYQSFGRYPRVLEAYGYDAAHMIREVVGRYGEKGITKALTRFQGYRGVTGIRGFLASESPLVDSYVIEVSQVAKGSE